MRHFGGLREGLKEGLNVILSVGIIVVHNMVGIGVVREVEIFPWTNLPVIPNRVITATKATTATKSKKLYSDTFSLESEIKVLMKQAQR